jgi:putative flippase GtrA
MRTAREITDTLAVSDKTYAQVIRFAIIGAISSGLYVVLASVLADAVGLRPGLAGAAAYISLLPVNFLAHKRTTFRSRQPFLQEVKRFVSLHGATLVVSSAVMEIGMTLMGWSSWASALAVAVLAPAINFLAMRYWVFRHTPMTSA